MKFNNMDLQRDLEKIKEFDEPVLSKDKVEDKFVIDVTDTSYSYSNETERNRDFDKLVSVLLPENKTEDELQNNQE